MTHIVTPGQAHFVVECAGCGKHISLGEVKDGEQSSPKTRQFDVACPHCRGRAIYAPAQVSKRYGAGDHGLSLLD